MSSLALVVKYMYKEITNPTLHHSNFTELVEDVDRDVFKCTFNYEHDKYIEFLKRLDKQY